MKRKYNETMIVRDGKLAYVIILDNKSNGNHSTYIYIRDGKIYFSQDSWFTSTRFDFEDETHRISKEIFVNQLQTDIKTRVLELKQLDISRFTISPESDKEIVSNLCNYNYLQKELIVYGKTPLLNMNYCLLRR